MPVPASRWCTVPPEQRAFWTQEALATHHQGKHRVRKSKWHTLTYQSISKRFIFQLFYASGSMVGDPLSPPLKKSLHKSRIVTYPNVFNVVYTYHVSMPLLVFCGRFVFWCVVCVILQYQAYMVDASFELHQELACTPKAAPRRVDIKEVSFRNIYGQIHWVWGAELLIN